MALANEGGCAPENWCLRLCLINASEEQIAILRRLLDTAPEPVLILWDAGAVITGWFMGAEKVFGYSATEAIGQPSSILYTAEDREIGIPEYEMAVALKRGYSENDRWMRKSDGSSFWASGVLNPIRSTTGELLGFAKNLRNRTDFKGKIDKLEKQLESLKQSDASRSLSVSTLAHEIRGPLSAVTYAVEVLKHAPPTQETSLSAMDIIEKQCRSMSRLVDDLLDASRLRIGKVRLNKARSALGEITEAALDTCRPQISARDQTVDFAQPSGIVWWMRMPCGCGRSWSISSRTPASLRRSEEGPGSR
jgi:PAS domain S-box-containing protein